MYYWVNSKFINEEIREFVTNAYSENGHSYMPANNAGAARWREVKKQFEISERVCSYCEAEGKDGYMGDFPGEMDTHGICKKHYEEQTKLIDAMRRINSGFYDSRPILSKVAEEVLEDLKNAR